MFVRCVFTVFSLMPSRWAIMMIVDPRRLDLSKLAADAQAARVTIYALLLEMPLFERPDDGIR